MNRSRLNELMAGWMVVCLNFLLLTSWVRILVQVTIYRRLLIDRDVHVDQSGDISTNQKPTIYRKYENTDPGDVATAAAYLQLVPGLASSSIQLSATGRLRPVVWLSDLMWQDVDLNADRYSLPSKTRSWSTVGFILGQRRKRWPNIKATQ